MSIAAQAERPVCRLASPGSGWLGTLAEAPDPVFAEGMMGDGLLLDPIEARLQAPCAGEIIAVASGGHAITLRTDIGAEILLHVGIDTVELGGRDFAPKVAAGQRVEAGSALLEFDMDRIAEAGKSLCTPIVVVNGDLFVIVTRASPGPIAAGDALMEIEPRPPAPAARASGGRAIERIGLPLLHGLHARPAARLVAVARRFEAEISLMHDGRRADARSVAGLMALDVGLGKMVTIEANGPDAAEAAASMLAAIAGGLGETPFDPVAGTGGEPPAPVALDGSASLEGVIGAPGTAIGPVVQLGAAAFDYGERGRGEAAEQARLAQALARVAGAIEAAGKNGGAEQRDILAAHIFLLEDPALAWKAGASIASGKSAEFAWASACGEIADRLSGLDNERLRERADDLRDVEAQVLAVLCGADAVAPEVAGAIVVAESLWPSQFLRLAAGGAAGICTLGGGATSHLSILAAGRGIPLLVAADPRLRSLRDGTEVALTADSGRIEVAPTPARRAAIESRAAARRANRDGARAGAQSPCHMLDGNRIEIFVNLGAPGEAGPAVAEGAEGCGLLRSEFLFMDRAAPPDEEEQLARYQQVADALDGRPLVIRTLDIGGDKRVPFLAFEAEENPALGLRGLRLSLRRPDLLKTQFRAILRLRCEGPVRVMLPMVIERAEIATARALLDEARAELGIEARVALGVMVETPAAALLAEGLARDADFFSIGTNDLTQYVLAIDRANVTLAHRFDGLHPSVLRCLGAVCRAGEAAGLPVSVCGALAGDILAIPVLIGLGVAELSIAPTRIAEVKAAIRTLKAADCRRFACGAVDLDDAGAVRAMVRQTWPQLDEWL